MNTIYYYIGDDNQSHGPVSEDELRRLGNEAKAHGRELLCCREGNDEWKSVNEILLAADVARTLAPAPQGVPAYGAPTEHVPPPLTAYFYYIVAGIVVILSFLWLVQGMDLARYIGGAGVVVYIFLGGLIGAGCLAGLGNIAVMANKAAENTRKILNRK